MILDFETDGDDLYDVGNRVVEGLLWNFWPRMMRDTPADKRFTCRVEVAGSPVKIPAPEDFPPLDLFTKAMRAVRWGQRERCEAGFFAETQEAARYPGDRTGSTHAATSAGRGGFPIA